MTDQTFQGTKRELLPDVLRGLAVIFVVLGHCIQEGSGMQFRQEALYFEDTLYQFLYSFHMPLFMLISGYFAWGSMKKVSSKKAGWKLYGKRSAAVLLPIVAWTVFDVIRVAVLNAIAGVQQPPISQTAIAFLYSFLTNFWFLWAVFWCFTAVFLVHFYGKDCWWLYLVLFLAFFFTPDGMGLGAYKYMMPYFLAGFYGHRLCEQPTDRWKRIEQLGKQHRIVLLAAVGVAFGALFLLYDADSLIYVSGYKLYGKDMVRQLGIDGYRMLIGFIGAGFVFLLMKTLLLHVPRRFFGWLARLGQDSMGIYILSGYVLILGMHQVTDSLEPSYAVNAVETIFVLLVTTLLTEVIRKLPFGKYIV